jgi:hypothetical protein
MNKWDKSALEERGGSDFINKIIREITTIRSENLTWDNIIDPNGHIRVWDGMVQVFYPRS